MLSKLKVFRTFFLAPSKTWCLPKRCEVLIYDAAGAEALAPYLTNYSMTVLPMRGESINVICFLRSIFTLDFWSGKPVKAYEDKFIAMVEPEVVITFIDNNPRFYELSKRLKGIKTIFVQNAIRGEIGDVFGRLVKSDCYRVDYMLVLGAAIGGKYRQFISGATLPIGSLKNNTVAKFDGVIERTVLFISQYRNKPLNNSPLLLADNGEPISFDEFYSAEVLALTFLQKWCIDNGMHLKIGAASSEKSGSEYQFYANVLNSCEWEYIPRIDQYSSYKLVDDAQIVVFIDSTLGYESISRGKRTASFSCRGLNLKSPATRFGWPACLPDNGPFWTNEQDIQQFQRVMDFLSTVNDDDWEQARQAYAFELIEFDPGNTRLIALLEQLLPKSES
jgi:surface carbohydrate biosynthesis protein